METMFRKYSFVMMRRMVSGFFSDRLLDFVCDGTVLDSRPWIASAFSAILPTS